MSQKKIIIFLLIAFLLVVFAASNQPRVRMNFFGFKSPETSLVVFVFGAVLIGGILTGIFGALNYVKFARDIKKKNDEIKSLKETIKSLEEENKTS